jgi:arsenate reductase (thioredoxin)
MPHVLFVCEHGSAKSVIAATYFNQMAMRRGLSLRAFARGISPHAEIPRPVVEGLEAEGLVPCTVTPDALSPADFVGARQVVAFDQPQLAAKAALPALVMEWDGLPDVSDNFGIARDAILAKVRSLVDDLKTAGGRDDARGQVPEPGSEE